MLDVFAFIFIHGPTDSCHVTFFVVAHIRSVVTECHDGSLTLCILTGDEEELGDEHADRSDREQDSENVEKESASFAG